jgi:predicted transcriptional regulator
MISINSSSRERMLKVLFLLLKEPEIYTLKGLAAEFNVSTDAIKDDFTALKRNGIIVNHNDFPDYQYYIENGKIVNNEIRIKI